MNANLRVATFLAPNMLPVSEFLTDAIGRELGTGAELFVGASFDQFADGEIDAGFICGLPYVKLSRQTPAPVEVLAAPVLSGDRYLGRPIYFSDVIVHRDSPFRTFADLRVIEVLGPSTIQTVVVARHLPADVKFAMRAVLLRMGDDPAGRDALAVGFVERLVPVTDGDYDDIRMTLMTAEQAGYLTIS